MLFHPKVKNPYGLKPTPKKRGRKSARERFLQQQSDLFPVELALRSAA